MRLPVVCSPNWSQDADALAAQEQQHIHTSLFESQPRGGVHVTIEQRGLLLFTLAGIGSLHSTQVNSTCTTLLALMSWLSSRPTNQSVLHYNTQDIHILMAEASV